jgi:lipoprotein-releasing system permease protein
MVGTMALITILSFYNGLDHLIRSLFSSFDPDIKITSVEGKTFVFDSAFRTSVEKVPGIADYSSVLEENALLRYRDRQTVATIKGVDPAFVKVSGIDTMLIDGEFKLYADSAPMGVIGQELAGQLGIGLNFINPVHVYVPRRTEKIILNPASAVSHRYLFPSGVFSIQQEYDSKYFIVPLGFSKELFGYPGQEVSAVELRLDGTRKAGAVKADLQKISGKEFKVAGRLEQHADFYRVMAAEKWAIFLILAFILIIASFNTISSLTLLMLEKKSDMQILQGLGARRVSVRQVFLWEGLLVTGTGMIAGLVLGAILCILQKELGIIRFPSAGSFVVDVYPVRMLWTDFIAVAALVSAIGFLAAWIPLRTMAKSYFSTISAEE